MIQTPLCFLVKRILFSKNKEIKKKNSDKKEKFEKHYFFHLLFWDFFQLCWSWREKILRKINYNVKNESSREKVSYSENCSGSVTLFVLSTTVNNFFFVLSFFHSFLIFLFYFFFFFAQPFLFPTTFFYPCQSSTLDNKARALGSSGRKGKLGIRPRNYLSNFFNVTLHPLSST